MKILSFGEVLWDIYPNEEYIGGASLNFAAHLAKMGEEVYISTSVGNDKLGEKTVNIIKGFGVKCDYISVSKKLETGKCLVSLDSNKIPKYNLLNNVAYDEIVCEDIPDNFDVIYFGTLALRNEFNRVSIKKLLLSNSFKEVFVDVNVRPPFYSKEVIEFAVSNATILKISDEELPVIAQTLCVDSKNFIKELCAKYSNVKLLIITSGGNGSFCYDAENNKLYSADSVNVKVASTVGAGDSFSAAFLHKFLNKSDIQSCLDFASKIAGFVVSKIDAVPEYNPENFE